MPKRLQFIKIQTMCIYATISHQQWAKPIMHSQPQKDDTWQNRKLLKWENPWVIYNITIQKTNMTNVINQFTTGPKPGTCTQKCRLVSIHPCFYLHMLFLASILHIKVQNCIGLIHLLFKVVLGIWVFKYKNVYIYDCTIFLGLSNPLDMMFHIQPWMIVGLLPLSIAFEGLCFDVGIWLYFRMFIVILIKFYIMNSNIWQYNVLS